MCKCNEAEREEVVRLSEISVTIKYHKGYEASWAVFRGESVEDLKNDLADYFGLDRESVTALPLHDVVLNVTQIAHGTQTAASVLGAVSIPGTPDAPDEGQANPWAQSGGEPAKPSEDPNGFLRDAIADATDVDSLKRLWAENQAAFAGDADLLAAWKAKGKSLKT